MPSESGSAAAATGRIAIGIAYRGERYHGWQSQSDGHTVQDHVETALSRFADHPIRTVCAGRTDTGVHALNQVAHFDAPVARDTFSWVRGTNRYLPDDIAVQWAIAVPVHFNARNAAISRRYRYLLLQSPVRPAIEHASCGWVLAPLDGDAMRDAAQRLVGEHDFSAFRSAECQAASPVKHLREISIDRLGSYWWFEFEASAFLHHMVRNLMGCLVAVGGGRREPAWASQLLQARDRRLAAPTFGAQGLYFVGPRYDPAFGIPQHTPAMDWLLQPRPS
jgi:tRNA pseudouridine38-40 synthase